MEVVPTGAGVHRHLDLREIGDLVAPVDIHQRVFQAHGALVVDAVEAGGAERREARERDGGDAALVDGLAVHVAHALPRGDAGQMRRLLRGDVPLADGERGGTGHGDFAVAPRLLGRPLDEVVAVLTVLDAELVVIALGVADAADVDVDDGVAVVAPVRGVDRLELGHRRNGALGNAGREADVLARAVLVGALAVIGPRQDGGRLLVGAAGLGAEDVAVQLDSVAHLDRDVLLADDAGSRLVGVRVERIGLGEGFLVLGELLPLLHRHGLEHLRVDLLVGLPVDGLLDDGLLAIFESGAHGVTFLTTRFPRGHAPR